MNPSGTYKLVEFDSGFVIIHPNDSLMNRANVRPLMLGSKDDLANYLVCYLDEREKGTDVATAHERALDYARIISRNVRPQ